MFSHQKPTHKTKKNSREHFFASKPSPDVAQKQALTVQRQTTSRTGRTFSATEVLAGDGITEVIQPQPIQTKLAIGEVGDKYEREADRVAKETVQHLRQQPLQRKKDAPPVQQRPISPYKLQRREELQGGEVSTELETQINRSKSGGQSLAPDLQGKMGRAMGTDFSHVKVHTDTHSDRLNQSLQAKAFTTGNHVFFKKGEYRPNSTRGQELLAHELTHVVQQNGGEVQRKTENTPMIQCWFWDSEETKEKKKKKKVAKRNQQLKSEFQNFSASYLNFLAENLAPKMLLKDTVDQKLWKYLLEAAKVSYIEENVLFLRDLKQYRNGSPSPTDLDNLYNTYIKPGGEHEVNINFSNRNKIINKKTNNQPFQIEDFGQESDRSTAAGEVVERIIDNRKQLLNEKAYYWIKKLMDKLGFSFENDLIGTDQEEYMSIIMSKLGDGH